MLYSDETSHLKQVRSLELKVGFQYKRKKADLRDPGHWGEGIDLYSLATIHIIKFKLVMVNSMQNMTVEWVEEIRDFNVMGDVIVSLRK